MGSTKAARERRKGKSVKLDPTLEKSLQAVKDKFMDAQGNLDVLVMLAAVKSLLGDEKFAVFEEKLVDHYAPEGMVDTFVSTWRVSKTQAILAGVGATAAIIAVCEVAGRALDIPNIKFATRLAQWIAD